MMRQEAVIKRIDNKPILVDYRYVKQNKQPLVVFCHGFKGFKDWGHFNLIADDFAQAGFTFIKMSFSHGGTTVYAPTDFADLDAFGNNNFDHELRDLRDVIDWAQQNPAISQSCDVNNVVVIGHSRGGGVAILAAAEDDRISQVITWAAVSDFKRRIAHIDVEHWRSEGVVYIPNARTNQEMPWFFQLYEDFMANEERYLIERAAKKLEIPHLILHGDEDETVPMYEAEELLEWGAHASLMVIAGGNHVFDGKHPFEEDSLPQRSKLLISHSINFLKS